MRPNHRASVHHKGPTSVVIRNGCFLDGLTWPGSTGLEFYAGFEALSATARVGSSIDLSKPVCPPFYSRLEVRCTLQVEMRRSLFKSRRP